MKTDTKTIAQIVFNAQSGQFALVNDRHSSTQIIAMGNADGFNRGMPLDTLPRQTVAKLSGTGKLAKLEIIAPNGDTLHQFGGRVFLKAQAEILRPFVASLLNEKRGGAIVQF